MEERTRTILWSLCDLQDSITLAKNNPNIDEKEELRLRRQRDVEINRIVSIVNSLEERIGELQWDVKPNEEDTVKIRKIITIIEEDTRYSIDFFHEEALQTIVEKEV